MYQWAADADLILTRVFHWPAERFSRRGKGDHHGMIGKVRRMKLRDQLSNSEIAKRTGLSRNTVKQWLKAPGDVIPRYETQWLMY